MNIGRNPTAIFVGGKITGEAVFPDWLIRLGVEGYSAIAFTLLPFSVSRKLSIGEVEAADALAKVFPLSWHWEFERDIFLRATAIFGTGSPLSLGGIG